MKFVINLLLFFFTSHLMANTYHGEIHSFKQPDGTLVDVKLYGSEYYIRAEGLDGYTVIRSKDKWIYYARLSEDKMTLYPSQIKYTGNSAHTSSLRQDLPWPKHQELSSQALRNAMDDNANQLFGQPSYKDVQLNYQKEFDLRARSNEPFQGKVKGLCIVFDFSDEIGTNSISTIEDFLNKIDYTGFGNNGSLRTYYRDISGGLLDYENVVFGVIRAPKTFKEYDDMPYAAGAKELLSIGLNWIKDKGFDFSTLSKNPDNTIMAINIMYTGDPGAWAQGMWFHAGYFGDFQANGVRSGRYNTSSATGALSIGTICHENGHMLCKWPDTYKYNNENGPDGIGAFDLMCSSGSFNPVPPNPYFLSQHGWSIPHDVTGLNLSINDTSNIHSHYAYIKPSEEEEYFILQNRIKKGRSANIPSEGLTIWHVYEPGDNQTELHEIALVSSVDDPTLLGQSPFRASRNSEFSDTTKPNANWYFDGESGLRVWDIGNHGEIMQYKVGKGSDLKFSNPNSFDDDDHDGHIEAGEKFYVSAELTNVSDKTIDLANIELKPFGTMTPFIDFVSPPIQINDLAPGDTTLVTFEVGTSLELPDYNLIKLRFEAGSEESSDAINYMVLSGKTISMNNAEQTTCEALFLDPGGFVDYENNTHIVQTFYPQETGKKLKIKFEEFDVEYSGSCRKDYLSVYNGVSTDAPLFGKYCGSELPPELISTDETGALTFEFITNEESLGTGWNALLECASSLDYTKIDDLSKVTIFPNPANHFFYLSLGTADFQSVEIYNLQNTKMASIKPSQNEHLLMIPTDKFVPGMYIVAVRSNHGTIIKKVVVR